MKIIFFGTPPFAVPSLEKLLSHPEFEVLAAVTQPDKRRGRGKKMMASAVKKVALEHQLPVWQPPRIKKDASTLAKLQQAEADAFAVVAYGQILSPAILDMPRLGCVNVHGSLLPKYRGAAPIQWSLYHGETETGVTTMLMNEGMDTGAMLLKAIMPIGLLDNACELAEKLSQQGADLLVKTLLKLQKGDIKPTPQDSEAATYASLIQKADYKIDWSRPALDIHNQVRGFFPNSTATLRGKLLKVMATVPLGEAYWEQLPPELGQLKKSWENLSTLEGSSGEVVSILKNLGPVVQTGQGMLLLKEVQLAGKCPQLGWDFVNGMRLLKGELLT